MYRKNDRGLGFLPWIFALDFALDAPSALLNTLKTHKHTRSPRARCRLLFTLSTLQKDRRGRKCGKSVLLDLALHYNSSQA